MKYKNYIHLKEFCRTLDVDLFGVADISGIKKDFLLSPEILEKFDKAICLGLGLSPDILAEISDAPTRLYFHHYRIVNSVLDQIAFKVSRYIQKNGFFAVAIPASQVLDWEKQRAHLSHKHIGRLAGLGWIGRNNLLVNKDLGSQLRLASILTDMPLKIDRPVEESCAACRNCIEACPAGAIAESPADFNHLGCFEKLKEFKNQKMIDHYICGICINTCSKKNGDR